VGVMTAPINNVINTIGPSNTSIMTLQPSLQNIRPPVYGCLKGGELPTFRTLMNQTRKTLPNNNTVAVHNVPLSTLSQNNTTVSAIGGGPPQHTTAENRINDTMKRIHEMKSVAAKMQEIKPIGKPKRMKQKKTLRRTYKIGKSKTAPKVSVLVSNRTIRTNITTKSQLIKQVPIEDVKRFLIKRGLIRVGSITPVDVLRKMYESAAMMCGEVHNHNPENLLYNFLNEK